jgi:HlyD family secretion protein
MKIQNYLIVLVFIFFLIGCSDGNNSDFIEESGTIETTNIVISSRASGNVKVILKNEGDKVVKNDTLIIIDHDLLKIKLKQAQAGIVAAEARLKLALTGARKEDISLAKERLNQATTNFNLAEADFKRMEILYKEQAITKKQFDDIKARFNIAKSQLNSAKQNLIKIKNISRPEEISQVRSNYENAKANIDLIKKQISDSHITSPIDGIVVERFIELGESVNYGSAIIKVSDLSKVKLVVYVNEENLGKVKLGQTAEISTDTYKDKTYTGKVIFISPEAEFTPKNIQTKDERTKLVFAVKIEIPNPDYELKAGMPADAKIKLQN